MSGRKGFFVAKKNLIASLDSIFTYFVFNGHMFATGDFFFLITIAFYCQVGILFDSQVNNHEYFLLIYIFLFHDILRML